jgi:hypothetical protein
MIMSNSLSRRMNRLWERRGNEKVSRSSNLRKIITLVVATKRKEKQEEETFDALKEKI